MNNKVREIRISLGMSQHELAEKAGISRTIVWQLETGKKKSINSATMLKISKVLNKPIEDIFLP